MMIKCAQCGTMIPKYLLEHAEPIAIKEGRPTNYITHRWKQDILTDDLKALIDIADSKAKRSRMTYRIENRESGAEVYRTDGK